MTATILTALSSLEKAKRESRPAATPSPPHSVSCAVLVLVATPQHVHGPLSPLLVLSYPEAGENLIQRISQRRLLVRFDNQYLNQLVGGVSESSASNRTYGGCTRYLVRLLVLR